MWSLVWTVMASNEALASLNSDETDGVKPNWVTRFFACDWSWWFSPNLMDFDVFRWAFTGKNVRHFSSLSLSIFFCLCSLCVEYVSCVCVNSFSSELSLPCECMSIVFLCVFGVLCCYLSVGILYQWSMCVLWRESSEWVEIEASVCMRWW